MKQNENHEELAGCGVNDMSTTPIRDYMVHPVGLFWESGDLDSDTVQSTNKPSIPVKPKEETDNIRELVESAVRKLTYRIDKLENEIFDTRDKSRWNFHLDQAKIMEQYPVLVVDDSGDTRNIYVTVGLHVGVDTWIADNDYICGTVVAFHELPKADMTIEEIRQGLIEACSGKRV